MSQFTVCRSWNGYCLLLDDDRIAGGKPDYHESNVFYEWRTRDTYGPVDELKAENAKLRELVRDMRKALFALNIDHCQACPRDTINGPCTKHLISGSDECNFEEEMRELGIEVGE